jgi:hypothetical protein
VAASQKERVKASKLRAKKKLTPAQHAWLSRYESNKAKPTAREATAALASELGAPILTANGLRTVAQYVHETKRLDDAIAPSAFTFKPVVPEGPSEPVAPGMPAPLPAGSPLVDPLPVQAAVAPTGADPVAKAQFQGMVMMLCMAGARSARELIADDESMPDMVRNALANPSEGLALVQASAGNLAEKWKLQRVPGGDEAVVGGACLASGLAIFAVQKKRKAAKGKKPANVETSPTTNAATSPRDEGVDVAPPPPSRAVNVSAFTGDDL